MTTKLVIVLKGNPCYVDNEPLATNFYNNIRYYLMFLGCDPIVLPGTPGTRPDRTHPEARLWIGHSMGTERLRFAGRGVMKLMLGVPEGMHHPKDDACIIKHCPKGWVPNEYHYALTEGMKAEIKILVSMI